MEALLQRLLKIKDKYTQAEDIFDDLDEIIALVTENLKKEGLFNKMSKSG